jgi:4-diphosphocytidyl-2-C-methyl-D-erythritol kinase
MKSLVMEAHAKINLNLSVGQRRPDGYHNIDSVMHTIALADTVIFTPAEFLSLSVTEGTAPAGEDNLMWQAAVSFARTAWVRPDFHLELQKRIPSGAGMGGGSADAAAVLLGLNHLYGDVLSLNTLCALAADLGADVPFCLMGGAARCEGIGNKMTAAIPWRGLSLVIAKPAISVSTKEAYDAIDHLQERNPCTSEQVLEALEQRNREQLGAALVNDFEAGLFPRIPELAGVSRQLAEWNRPHMMTGSGAAFFVMAEDRDEAEYIAAHLMAEHRDWYVAVTETW